MARSARCYRCGALLWSTAYVRVLLYGASFSALQSAQRSQLVFLPLHPQDDFALAQQLTADLQIAIFVLADSLKAAGLYIWREWEPSVVDSGPLTTVGFLEPRAITQNRLGSYSVKTNRKILPLERLQLFPNSTDLFKGKTAGPGWCPNEYSMLRQILSRDTTGLLIASRLRRSFSDLELSHDSCTTDRCVANQVEDGTYQRKHTAGCPDPVGCRNMVIDSDVAAQMIRQGRLPLVRIEFAPFEQWENKYRLDWTNWRSERHTPVEMGFQETENYIAISHVWSHGLGNPEDNALPECQLRRLKHVAWQVQKAEGMVEEPAIWIDTLCIPVQQKHHNVRKKAIGTISEVFRQARRVVVLDADLQQTSFNIDRTELCISILLCGWMRRLWTLNEAVIS